MRKWTPKRIKDLRQKLSLSQTAFGKLLGVTRHYIYYLEKGVRVPSKTLSLLLDCIEKEKGGEKEHGKRNLQKR